MEGTELEHEILMHVGTGVIYMTTLKLGYEIFICIYMDNFKAEYLYI